jgi:YspA, cpYpsA-related SLOG family
MMRILACGDRNWTDREFLVEVLDGFGNQYLWDFVLVHGAARGADTMADDWAKARDIPVESYPAHWEKYGKAAGPVRNEEMLRLGIDLVIAFHDDIRHSKGTKHMVGIARNAGVPVKLIYHQGPLTINENLR